MVHVISISRCFPVGVLQPDEIKSIADTCVELLRNVWPRSGTRAGFQDDEWVLIIRLLVQGNSTHVTPVPSPEDKFSAHTFGPLEHIDTDPVEPGCGPVLSTSNRTSAVSSSHVSRF